MKLLEEKYRWLCCKLRLMQESEVLCLITSDIFKNTFNKDRFSIDTNTFYRTSDPLGGLDESIKSLLGHSEHWRVLVSPNHTPTHSDCQTAQQPFKLKTPGGSVI